MKRRNERGMVTVELAGVSVLVAGLVALCGWFGVQLLLLDRCQIVASQVARQAARSDAAAVQRASAEAPPGASVQVSDAGGATTVVVRFAPVLLGVAVGSMEAKATVLDEAKS